MTPDSSRRRTRSATAGGDRGGIGRSPSLRHSNCPPRWVNMEVRQGVEMTSRRWAGGARMRSAGARRRASREHTGPTLEFTFGTPYEHYVGAEALHALQRPVTDVPEE